MAPLSAYAVRTLYVEAATVPAAHQDLAQEHPSAPTGPRSQGALQLPRVPVHHQVVARRAAMLDRGEEWWHIGIPWCQLEARLTQQVRVLRSSEAFRFFDVHQHEGLNGDAACVAGCQS